MTSPELKVAFITLGCAKNEVDTDKMRARVLAAGLTLVEDVELADTVIINTCSFITEATEESIATILEVAGLERFAAGPGRILVTGCMPSRYGAELTDGFPEVAAFICCDQEEDIVAILLDVTKGTGHMTKGTGRMTKGTGRMTKGTVPFVKSSDMTKGTVPFVMRPVPFVTSVIASDDSPSPPPVIASGAAKGGAAWQSTAAVRDQE
ncbi:MAG: hypothetical protein FWF91_07415, partial [Coriobacteriia bacterium]|nr:hypothetical protein [Coriobacteriia bacterium]